MPFEFITVRDRDFRVVGVSKNLRGVLGRSRRVRLERVDIWPGAGGSARIGMIWVDGSSTIFDFADMGVARGFFESRVKRLAWPAPVFHGRTV